MKRVKIEVGWNHLRSVRITSCHEYINGWRTIQIFWCFDFFFFDCRLCEQRDHEWRQSPKTSAERCTHKNISSFIYFFVVRQSCCPDSRSAVFWRPKILNVIVYGAGECHCNEEEEEGIRMAMLILAVVVVVVVLDARIGESMRPHAVITTHSHTHDFLDAIPPLLELLAWSHQMLQKIWYTKQWNNKKNDDFGPNECNDNNDCNGGNINQNRP